MKTLKITFLFVNIDYSASRVFIFSNKPTFRDLYRSHDQNSFIYTIDCLILQVEIKGFLYNLSIQKKSINALSEINDIKHFLEQCSLVHNNTSLSLRDDTKNEIIFKIHKNRDTYQTLSSIYGIKKMDLQELKVEKNQYKVTAFIGKRDAEQNQKQLIFLNGKIVQNGKLQSIINHNLSKTLKLNYEKKRNLKSKVGFHFYFY